jgi:hypothetical protein
VNLSLTVNATSYTLANTWTARINGTGQFLINATPTTLTFSTANADGQNSAILYFLPSFPGLNEYHIGSDSVSMFEEAITGAGDVFARSTLPTVFGTAVPEPSTRLLLGIGAISLFGYRKAKSHG